MSAQAHVGAWQIGEWIVDPKDDTLTRDTIAVKIEPRMMRLLMRLAESPGEVVSQERLHTDVWAGVVVGPASVYQSVSQLRKVLGDTSTPASYIETVARKGYRLVAPVRRPEQTNVPTSGASAPGAPAESHRLRWIVGIAVALIIIAAGIFVTLRPTERTSGTSIAVMPFVDMSAGKTEQPFCDGVTEELSNWLSQIPTLRVVARRSAYAFRDKQTDVREIGRALGTEHVLEGSLRRSGNSIRVSIQLIATRDGYSLWSGSFDSALIDVIKVQEQIAHAVANSLEIRLSEATSAKFADRQSSNGQAYSLYLIARYHQQQRTKQDNDRAIELYGQAIAADPHFALAKVGLAYAYLNQRYFNDRPIASIAQDAQPLLASAAATAPQLADLYVVRGALETELLERDAAIRDLRHAVALNPNSRDAMSELGFYHLVTGAPRESLQYYTRAAELDPLDYNLHAQRCLALSDLAQFAAAAAACEKARALDPAAAWVYSASGFFEEARGQIAEALKWNAAALARSPGVPETFALRGDWQLSLDLPERARETYDAAMVATGNDTENVALTWLGLVTAYAHGGARAMHDWIAARGLESSKNPELLFDLANSELIAGDTRAAQAYADRALGSPDLKPDVLASPWLARSGSSYLLIAAAARLANGDPESAMRNLAELSALLERLTTAGMRRHGVYELQAKAAALRGDADAAMLALQRAADLGWRDIWLAEHEPYFAALRARADYRALIERIRRENAVESAKLGADASVPASPRS
jgi:TolB-like protein/DNA-binding winged helix-turn-helix (wHTH) protein/Tfp pilus assembly protein PilF